MLVWAEIGEGVALAVGGLALAADLQSIVQPHLPSLKIWLGNYIPNLLPITSPISTVSASLYWANSNGNGWRLATYDEIISQNGLFVCLSDKGTNGALFVDYTPVPGSITRINEEMYKENYCRYLGTKEGWGDIVSGMNYCKNVQFR
jgi:hypothetical protein